MNDQNQDRERSMPKWLGAILWMTVGFAGFYLLALDPLDFHPLDDWFKPSPIGTGEQIAAPEDAVLFYRNPMDPTITSPVPTQDDMGMDYVPVYASAADAGPSSASTVTIDSGVVQNINVRTEVVELRNLVEEIRTVGSLGFDPERMTTVTPKYSGWVEKVYVNYVGEPVRRGQALFEIYSPELVQTEQELLSAVRYAARFEDNTPDAKRRAHALVDAARTRLSYWDISPRQIAKLEQDGEIARTLIVVSPTSGVVMKRMPGLEGMAVQPGMEIYHIANLSSLWLSVDLFEEHLAVVGLGTEAKVTLDYLPGESFYGVVRFLEPSLSEQTRTLKAKVEIDNRDGRLRPGMFASVVLSPTAGAPVVTVPAQSVLRTGRRNVVIVALGGGRFDAREVVLGRSGRGYSEIASGLEAGEQVVVSSQFLIDSEANIQAVIRQMTAEDPVDSAAAAESRSDDSTTDHSELEMSNMDSPRASVGDEPENGDAVEGSAEDPDAGMDDLKDGATNGGGN